MINPMKLLQLKGMWDGFVSRHPKFPNFLKVVSQVGIYEGTVLEIQVTTPEGKNFTSNIKVQKEDVEVLKTILDMKDHL